MSVPGINNPPQIFNGSFASSAVAGTDTTHTLIAAPGAGKSIVVVAFTCAIAENSAGNIVRLRSTAATGVPIACTLALAGTSGWGIAFPYPGSQQGGGSSGVTNQPLTIISRPSAAVAVAFSISILYYIVNIN